MVIAQPTEVVVKEGPGCADDGQRHRIADKNDGVRNEIVDAGAGEQGNFKDRNNPRHNRLDKVVDQHAVAESGNQIGKRTGAVIDQKINEGDGDNDPDQII